MIYKTQVTREDALKLIELAELFHKESRYKDVPFNPQNIWNILNKTLSAPQDFFIVYAMEEEQPVAAFLAHRTVEYFTGRQLAADLGIYVAPHLRGGMTFVRMLKKFEEWAKEQQVDRAVLYHSSGIDPEQSKKLFPRLGYEHYGYCFDKEL